MASDAFLSIATTASQLDQSLGGADEVEKRVTATLVLRNITVIDGAHHRAARGKVERYVVCDNAMGCDRDPPPAASSLDAGHADVKDCGSKAHDVCVPTQTGGDEGT